ncbi:SPFH domain-containing protein [Schaalia suimastitidis]|uniref:SPFH domain-containing protein n=1 Tax=Schaalia suimastitidis TaxID=121163 RepID=UPI000409572B|nr:SPFH domain-containing protein [Schaalia suimastitidis]
MGLFKAAAGAIGGVLADQWREAIEPTDMGEGVVFCKGSRLRPDDSRGANRKGTDDIITNGSAIHVYDRQAMMLIDGGRIADFAAEPGIFTVDHSTAPSIFSGELRESVVDTWKRFTFGGVTPQKQQAFYINLQEIKGIKFGTPNALNYFDTFYNAELFLRCHGTFSIKIVDPILFYQEVIPRDALRLHIDDVKEQYMSEFLEALQTSINQMSVDGIRISQVASKMRELSQYMRDTLDEDWLRHRGMEIQAVGIASISYDEESRKLIDMRNQGAMLSDPSVREGYVQGAVARGMEAAGSNEAGAGLAFMGMGMGMQAGGGFMQAASQSNQAQMAQQQYQQPYPPQYPPMPGQAPAGYPRGYPQGYPPQGQAHPQQAPGQAPYPQQPPYPQHYPQQAPGHTQQPMPPAPPTTYPGGNAPTAGASQQVPQQQLPSQPPTPVHGAAPTPQAEAAVACSKCGTAFSMPEQRFCAMCGAPRS